MTAPSWLDGTGRVAGVATLPGLRSTDTMRARWSARLASWSLRTRMRSRVAAGRLAVVAPPAGRVFSSATRWSVVVAMIESYDFSATVRWPS